MRQILRLVLSLKIQALPNIIDILKDKCKAQFPFLSLQACDIEMQIVQQSTLS